MNAALDSVTKNASVASWVRDRSAVAAVVKGPLDGVIDLVSKRNLSLFESASISLIGGSAAVDAAKADFLAKMQAQSDFAIEVLGRFEESTGSKAVQEAVATVLKFGRDATQAMETAWAVMERARLDQARLEVRWCSSLQTPSPLRRFRR